jgi:Protein of unknown function (DUF1566)
MKKLIGTIVAIMMVAILAETFIMAKYAAAGEKARDGRFIAYNNGTVLDTKTNLMWAAKDNGSDIKWADAKLYCENYRGGGYTDWRMPTQDELAGLYDASKSRLPENRGSVSIHVATKLIDITGFAVCASLTIGGGTAYFNFRKGKPFEYAGMRRQAEQDYIRALPVRSGK